jgi:hypothetical protein
MMALQSISVTGLNLTAGQSYFLVVVASQSNSDLVWYMSSDTTGTTVRSNGTWETYSNSAYEPAFKIVGETTPVPIPAAVWLLGSGLIGLIGIRRFRK